MFYDVIIIGSGIGGLYTCTNLDDSFRVLLVAKDKLDLNNSALAQGGIAGVLDIDDTFDEHIEDTLIAGNYKNNLDHVEIMVNQGPKEILKLIQLGVDFDKNDNGELIKTLEGGHRRRRIVHHKDKTGYEVVKKLIKNIKNKKNVDILENSFLSSVTKHNEVFELNIIKENDENMLLNCAYLVFATGGIGMLYKYTTNSSISTGDGIAMAHLLGAKIKGLDLIQFHPTALNIDENERFLISEAVRGEGAYLLNNKGQRFMSKYDKRLELAPRDVVSKSIIEEMEVSNSEEIYIDISYKEDEFVKRRFPNIYEKCLEYGIDMTKDKIPVFPSQHYLMGGIEVNKNSESTIDNLYAVGECSNTGVHGSNRLASNSLLEGLVFAKRAANDINKKQKKIYEYKRHSTVEIIEGNEKISDNYKKDIQSIMQKSCFVRIDKTSSIEGLNKIDKVLNDIKVKNYKRNKDYYETRNIALISKLILGEIIKDDK